MKCEKSFKSTAEKRSAFCATVKKCELQFLFTNQD